MVTAQYIHNNAERTVTHPSAIVQIIYNVYEPLQILSSTVCKGVVRPEEQSVDSENSPTTSFLCC